MAAQRNRQLRTSVGQVSVFEAAALSLYGRVTGWVVLVEDGNLAEGTASADAGKCKKPTVLGNSETAWSGRK